MTRVLHVLDADASFEAQRCAEELARRLGEGFDLRTRSIGRGGDWRNLPAAALGLRRETDIDVVHAWGPTALMAAAVASPAKIIYSPPAAPTPRSLRWLRAIMQYRDVRVVCTSEAQRRAMAMRGIDPDRTELVRPGVDFSRARRRKDADLRASLGLKPDDRVLLAVGESTREANHRLAVWAAGILHVYDPRFRLLLWGRGERIDQAERFNRRMIDPQLLCVAERRLGRIDFEQLLGVADMAIVTATGNVEPLPICQCMAAGLPLVAMATPMLSELLEDRYSAMMVGRDSAREFAQRVLKLSEDAQLQWKLADTARNEAYQFYSMTRFVEEWRQVYRAKEPIVSNPTLR